jgi:hypothetical protein
VRHRRATAGSRPLAPGDVRPSFFSRAFGTVSLPCIHEPRSGQLTDFVC